MNDDEYKDPLEAVRSAQLRLSASTLHTLSKINPDQASIQDVVHSLEQTMMESLTCTPNELCDLISVQARVLDAAFMNLMDQARDNPEKLCHALRLQQQTLRTLMAWKALKTDIYIKRKIVQFSGWEKNRAERSEQNAPLDG